MMNNENNTTQQQQKPCCTVKSEISSYFAAKSKLSKKLKKAGKTFDLNWHQSQLALMNKLLGRNPCTSCKDTLHKEKGWHLGCIRKLSKPSKANQQPLPPPPPASANAGQELEQSNSTPEEKSPGPA